MLLTFTLFSELRRDRTSAQSPWRTADNKVLSFWAQHQSSLVKGELCRRSYGSSLRVKPKTTKSYKFYITKRPALSQASQNQHTLTYFNKYKNFSAGIKLIGSFAA